MNFLTTLNGPIHVAWFQYLCGVRWKYPDARNKIYPANIPLTSKDDERNVNNQFVITDKISFYAAKAGSLLAAEPFFYIFFPFCSWIFHLTIARRALLMLTVSMVIGQCLKDTIKQPRPLSPPVIRLESLYETEYGMPSTHVSTAVSVSFSLLTLSSQFYLVPPNIGFTLACLWSGSVLISRIYLGMHTILQVISGAALSLFIVYFGQSTVSWFEQYQLSSSPLFSCCFSMGALLLAFFMFSLDAGIDPKTGKAKWNTARGDTTELLGLCTGFFLGSKYAIDYGILVKPRIFDDLNLPLFADIGYSTIVQCSLRFVIGGALVLPIFLIMRKTLLYLLVNVNGYQKLKIDAVKRIREIELPYKFFSTFIFSILGTLVMPIALQYLGLW